jgi:uncharacterized protein YijF (DUF1287 family)
VANVVTARNILFAFLPASALICGCHRESASSEAAVKPIPTTPFQSKLVAGLRDQLTWGTGYNQKYMPISYPNGDVPRKTGVCTDVVIRAYRHAGFDLQRLIHEDMVAAWSQYPRYSGLPFPDTNIDHRRVPNQAVFFERHGAVLTTDTQHPSDWQPGDVVEWKLFGRLNHTGMLSDHLGSDGFPLVIHNMGSGPQEEDVLRATGWRVTGHFRYPAPSH